MILTHKTSCATITDLAEYTAWIAQYEKDVKEYTEQWPNHCKDCRGWGGHSTSYDPSPPGIGLSPGCLWEYSPCTSCVEQDKCPRCGETPLPLVEDDKGDYFHCKQCEWKDNPDNMIAGLSLDPPTPPECDCWDFNG